MIDVFLRRVSDYPQAVQSLPDLLDRILPSPAGLKILIKPNFVALRNAELSCTHPAVIAAAARHLRDRGARVTVGDSPAFGTAEAIASKIKLTPILKELGVRLITLSRPRRITAHPGLCVSADALEADLILNLPKLKAHSQMRLTGAVKNLFGCVTGVRKAWLHALHGDKGHAFTGLICDLPRILPPAVSIMDGVEAMHVTGPIAGRKFFLGMIGASTDVSALDTAAGMILRVSPEEIPVWDQCLRMEFSGARPENLRFPFLSPEDFDAKGFILPGTLKPESFRPDILVKSLFKRLWLSMRRN